MHKLLCSQCLRRVNVSLPSLQNRRLSCSHVRPYSRWFALYEDVNQVDIPISELPPSSSYAHTAPIGLNERSSLGVRRSASSSYVPTIEDDSQLGGRDTVDDTLGNVLPFSTGSPSTSLYDLDSLLATVEESNLELPLLDVIPSRDLLPASSLRGSSPLRKPSRASVEKEKKSLRSSSRGQGIRSRLASSSAANAAAAATNPVAVASPRVEERLVEMDQVPSVTPTREGEVNVDDLLAIANRQDMEGLRSLLKESYWPKNAMTSFQVGTVFSLVVNRAKDCDECREMMRDFAGTSTRHALPYSVLIQFITRSLREEGMERAREAMEFHRMSFMMAPTSSGNTSDATLCLWREVVKKDDERNARKMVETAMREGIVKDVKMYVRENLNLKATSGASASSLFRSWCEMGQMYGHPEIGMDTVVRMAMRLDGSDNQREEALGMIARRVAAVPALHVDTFVAHLVFNLLFLDQSQAAKFTFSMISVGGKNWREVLREMEEQESSESLELVEKLANLITFGVVGEVTPVKKIKGKAVYGPLKESEVNPKEEKIELTEMMEKVVWIAMGGKPRQKKGKKIVQVKKRALKTNVVDLHQLTERIQKTWMNLEEIINGPSSPGLSRLFSWSLFHRLAIPQSLSHLVPSKEKERESEV